MKFSETEFFGQLLSVIAGSVLLVMTCAFISIPATLARAPGAVAAIPAAVHLT